MCGKGAWVLRETCGCTILYIRRWDWRRCCLLSESSCEYVKFGSVRIFLFSSVILLPLIGGRIGATVVCSRALIWWPLASRAFCPLQWRCPAGFFCTSTDAWNFLLFNLFRDGLQAVRICRLTKVFRQSMRTQLMRAQNYLLRSLRVICCWPWGPVAQYKSYQSYTELPYK